jgi:hypothetical protein
MKKFKVDYAISEVVKGVVKVHEKTIEGDDVDELLESIFKSCTDTYVVIKTKNFELVSPSTCITGKITERRNRK